MILHLTPSHSAACFHLRPAPFQNVKIRAFLSDGAERWRYLLSQPSVPRSQSTRIAFRRLCPLWAVSLAKQALFVSPGVFIRFTALNKTHCQSVHMAVRGGVFFVARPAFFPVSRLNRCLSVEFTDTVISLSPGRFSPSGRHCCF